MLNDISEEFYEVGQSSRSEHQKMSSPGVPRFLRCPASYEEWPRIRARSLSSRCSIQRRAGVEAGCTSGSEAFFRDRYKSVQQSRNRLDRDAPGNPIRLFHDILNDRHQPFGQAVPYPQDVIGTIREDLFNDADRHPSRCNDFTSNCLEVVELAAHGCG